MTDAELLRAARNQDAEAWKTFYTRYLPLVWRYAYAQVQDVHLAEDLVSETMLALLKNIHQIESETAHIAGWLKSVVRHKVADHHRKSYRTRHGLEKISREVSSVSLNGCPVASVEAGETCDQVLEVLDQLPPKHRLVLEFKYAEGMRVREIAERLGETEKGVEALLYRARKEFRRCFEAREREGVLNAVVNSPTQ